MKFISRCTVHPGDNYSAKGDCDLAVAVDPDDDILDNAFKSLKDGGSCYIVWNLRPFQSTSSIRKKLGEHGLSETSLYAMRVNGPNGSLDTWIPIDADTAMEYILSAKTKNNSISFSKYLTFTAQNLVFRLMPALTSSYPVLTGSRIENVTICSVSRKPGTGNSISDNGISLRDAHSVNELQSLIEKTLCILSNNQYPESKTEKAFIYIFGKDTSTDLVLLYVFNGSNPKPYFFVKVSRSEESTPDVRAEFENLRYIYDRTGGIPEIPKALFSLDFERQAAIGESYVSGTPLDSIIGKNNYEVLCRKVCDWILNFGEKTRVPAGEDAWDKLIGSSFLRPKAPSLSAWLGEENLRRIEEEFRGINLQYLVCEHRDFGPWNILVDTDGMLGVIDWADARPNGLPLLDLVYFLANITFHYDGAWKTRDFKRSYRKLLDPDSFTGKCFHECLSLYADRFGIPSKNIRSLRLLCWLIPLAEDTVSIDKAFFGQLMEEELEYRSRA